MPSERTDPHAHRHVRALPERLRPRVVVRRVTGVVADIGIGMWWAASGGGLVYPTRSVRTPPEFRCLADEGRHVTDPAVQFAGIIVGIVNAGSVVISVSPNTPDRQGRRRSDPIEGLRRGGHSSSSS